MVTKERKENAITKGVVKEFMKKKNNRMTSHDNLTLIKTKSVICHCQQPTKYSPCAINWMLDIKCYTVRQLK